MHIYNFASKQIILNPFRLPIYLGYAIYYIGIGVLTYVPFDIT